VGFGELTIDSDHFCGSLLDLNREHEALQTLLGRRVDGFIVVGGLSPGKLFSQDAAEMLFVRSQTFSAFFAGNDQMAVWGAPGSVSPWYSCFR
jgi:DNA-binding LacI/PurR family transcriptional regulator